MKNFIIKILIFFRIPFLFRFFFQKSRVTVLFYHDIDKEPFARQLGFLKKRYHLITLKALNEYLYENSVSLPEYSLLITFDDGHINNYYLLDLFKKYNIRPVIFLTANIIGTNKAFWFKLPFANDSIKEHLKTIPDRERRLILERDYKMHLDLPCPDALTTDQINEMTPFVDFQSHSMDHPCLPNSEENVARHEIFNSKQAIEKITDESVYAIAYPNGDFSEREIDLTKKAGYTLGFSTNRGFVKRDSNPFNINRISVNDTNNFEEFMLRVTGVWFFLKKIKLL